MDSIKIAVGRSTKNKLGQLYELHGISPEQAAQQGLQDYVRNKITEEEKLNQILETSVEDAREKTVRRKEFHQ